MEFSRLCSDTLSCWCDTLHSFHFGHMQSHTIIVAAFHTNRNFECICTPLTIADWMCFSKFCKWCKLQQLLVREIQELYEQTKSKNSKKKVECRMRQRAEIHRKHETQHIIWSIIYYLLYSFKRTPTGRQAARLLYVRYCFAYKFWLKHVWAFIFIMYERPYEMASNFTSI